jgi:hypothetical protein
MQTGTKFLALVLVAALWRAVVGGPVSPLSAEGQSVIDPSYSAVFPDGVWFLQWTESDRRITGQFQRVFVTPDDPLVVRSENTQIIGVRNGSDLSLNSGGAFPSATWTGTIRGSTINLTVPSASGLLTIVVLKASTVEDYNKAALAFRQRIAQQAALVERERQRQAVIAAHRRAVANASAALASALHRIGSLVKELARDTDFRDVLRAYPRDWETMQRDYQQLKSDAAKEPFDCYQLSTVKYDLSTLEYDLSSIRYDNGSFSYVGKTVENEAEAVAEAIAEIQKALSNLRSTIASNEKKTPGTAIVYFENYSSATAYFFVDGNLACTAATDDGCTIVLSLPSLHRLSAVTSSRYETPEIALRSRDGAIYSYLACGAMGNPGENCGLFVLDPPPDIDAPILQAKQQLENTRNDVAAAEAQRDKFNQEAEQLLETAKDFVATLTCTSLLSRRFAALSPTQQISLLAGVH